MVLIGNILTLTCTEKICAYLDSTSNFLLENVYFDHGRSSNKKVIQLIIFEVISHLLLQHTM